MELLEFSNEKLNNNAIFLKLDSSLVKLETIQFN